MCGCELGTEILPAEASLCWTSGGAGKFVTEYFDVLLSPAHRHLAPRACIRSFCQSLAHSLNL